MTVGVYDAHNLISFHIRCHGYNKAYRRLSTPLGTLLKILSTFYVDRKIAPV
jgi:hypothetical protein